MHTHLILQIITRLEKRVSETVPVQVEFAKEYKVEILDLVAQTSGTFTEHYAIVNKAELIEKMRKTHRLIRKGSNFALHRTER